MSAAETKKGAWRFWVELFSVRERGDSLALFRIALAACVLYSLLTVALTGIVDVLWVDVSHGGMRALRGNWLVVRLGGATPGVVHGLYGVSVGTALLLLAGAGGRVTPFILYLCYTALTSINGDASGGSDLMIQNALWIMVLGNGTATLSADCRLRTGRWQSDRLVAAWPRYLIAFQMIVIYTSTGWQKLSINWTPGGGYSALYWVLQDPIWTRWDGELFATLYPLTQIGTAMTWHWEQLAPLLLLVGYYRHTADRPGRLRALLNRRDLRKPWLAIGACMHLGILLLLDVGPFSWVSLAFYLCFWNPDELGRAGAWIRRRWPGGADDPAEPDRQVS